MFVTLETTEWSNIGTVYDEWNHRSCKCVILLILIA